MYGALHKTFKLLHCGFWGMKCLNQHAKILPLHARDTDRKRCELKS